MKFYTSKQIEYTWPLIEKADLSETEFVVLMSIMVWQFGTYILFSIFSPNKWHFSRKHPFNVPFSLFDRRGNSSWSLLWSSSILQRRNESGWLFSENGKFDVVGTRDNRSELSNGGRIHCLFTHGSIPSGCIHSKTILVINSALILLNVVPHTADVIIMKLMSFFCPPKDVANLLWCDERMCRLCSYHSSFISFPCNER